MEYFDREVDVIRLLLAEDETRLDDALCQLLKMEGYDVDYAAIWAERPATCPAPA